MRPGLIILLALLAAAPAFAAEESVPEPYPLDKATTTVFACYHGSGTLYYAFAGDGTYQRIAREHMGVFEMDTGTWAQDPSGDLRLESTKTYERITTGPLMIHTGYAGTLEALPESSAKLRAFLDAHAGEDSFTSASVERIERLGVNDSVARFQVIRPVERVGRADLEALLAETERFVRAPRRATSLAVPARVEGREVLVWKEGDVPTNTKYLARWVRETPPGKHHMLLYMPIPLERFLEESQRRQPFVFHPQMNCDTTVPLIR